MSNGSYTGRWHTIGKSYFQRWPSKLCSIKFHKKGRKSIFKGEQKYDETSFLLIYWVIRYTLTKTNKILKWECQPQLNPVTHIHILDKIFTLEIYACNSCMHACNFCSYQTNEIPSWESFVHFLTPGGIWPNNASRWCLDIMWWYIMIKYLI